MTKAMTSSDKRTRKVFLLAGFRLDATREYSDYKRFTTKTDDAKLDAPAKQ